MEQDPFTAASAIRSTSLQGRQEDTKPIDYCLIDLFIGLQQQKGQYERFQAL